MSAIYHAYAILGVLLLGSDCFRTKEVKAFPHDYPKEWRVEPTTGKTLYRTEKVGLLDHIADHDLFGYSVKKNGDPTAICRVDHGDDDSYVYVGMVADDQAWDRGQGTVPMQVLNPATFSSVKCRVQALLEPLHLWDEKNFGMWACQYLVR